MKSFGDGGFFRAWAWALIAPLGLWIGACEDASSAGQRCGIPVTHASPRAGLYSAAADQRITLTSDRPATIYFTLDGSIPAVDAANCRSGPTFCGESPVSNIPIAYSGMRLQFFAIDRCGNQEQIRTEVYTLDRAPETSAEPPPGTYNHPVTVTFIAVDESDDTTAPTIYVTTDGSVPDPSNPAATSGSSPLMVPIDATTQVKWMAIDGSGNQESPKTGQYVIDTEPPISEAEPPGGAYDDAQEVVVHIVNDTGNLYYTTNGAVPVIGGDSNGFTQIQALQRTINVTSSMFIRYTSVDKAQNRELHEGDANDVTVDGVSFNQDAYVINDIPALIATPPGGSYSENHLEVRLTAAPSDSVIFYSLDGAPEEQYTGTPIAISGTTVTLAYRAERSGGVIQTPVKTEIYELGVAAETTTVTESFDSTDRIDTAETDALIDTANGEARLPNVPIEQTHRVTNTTPQAGVPATPWRYRVGIDASLATRVAVVVDGAPQLLGYETTGANAPGLKIYTWSSSSDADPNPAFADVFAVPDFATGPYHGVQLVRPDGVGSATLIAAVAESAGGDVVLVDLSTPTNAVQYASLDIPTLGAGDSPPAMVAQVNPSPGSNLLFVGRRTAGTFENDIVAVEFDTGAGTAVVTGSVNVSTGATAEVVAMALNPLDPAQVFVLTEDCRIFVADFTTVTAPTILANQAYVGAACASNALVARDMTMFYDGAVTYAAVVYTTQDAGQNVSLVRLTDRAVRGGILNPDEAPAAPAWSVRALFSTSSSTRVLALSGNDGVYLYDLSNITSVFSGSRIAARINIGTDPDGLAVDGLAVFSAGGTDEFVFGSLWGVLDATPRGGLGVWKVPSNLRDKISPAVVRSLNVNPTGKKIRAVKLLEADDVGDVDYAVAGNCSGPSPTFQVITVGETETISPASDNICWRAQLTNGATEPKIRSLSLRLDVSP